MSLLSRLLSSVSIVEPAYAVPNPSFFSASFGEFSITDPAFAGGAVGDGVNDDTNAIQACINAAAAAGHTSSISAALGATVIVPPGNFKVVRPLTNPNSGGWVRIKGAGRLASSIFGNFLGYIIDQNGLVSGGGIIIGVESLQVTNSYTGAGAGPACGAIRWNFQAYGGFVVRDCLLSGATGIMACPFGFNTIIDDCNINSAFTISGTAGSVGIWGAQIAVRSTTILGFDWGVAFSNAGNQSSQCRMESCNTGWVLGQSATVTTAATTVSSGNTLTVISGDDVATGMAVVDATTNTSLGTVVSGPTGSPPQFIVTPNISSTVTTGDIITFVGDRAASGVEISGGSCERCNTGIDIFDAGSTFISGMALTGMDPPVAGLGLTCSYGVRIRSAANTTLHNVSVSGTHKVADLSLNGASNVSQFTVVGFTSSNGATFNTSASTASGNQLSFSAVAVGNMSGVAAGANGSVVTNLTNPSSISPGTTVSSVTSASGTVTVTLSASVASTVNSNDNIAFSSPGVDLSGISAGAGITLTGISPTNPGGLSINWNGPTSIQAAFQYINCTNPAFPLTFAQLPGSPVEGMTFDISDSPIASWGSSVTTGGGTGITAHRRLRWDSANWRVMG